MQIIVALIQKELAHRASTASASTPEAGPGAGTGIFMGCLFTFGFLTWMVPLKCSLRKWMCLQQSAKDSVPGPKYGGRQSKSGGKIDR